MKKKKRKSPKKPQVQNSNVKSENKNAAKLVLFVFGLGPIIGVMVFLILLKPIEISHIYLFIKNKIFLFENQFNQYLKNKLILKKFFKLTDAIPYINNKSKIK